MPYRFMRFPEGKTKAVTFSYDDGVRDDMRLADICDKYGVKATFNICSSLIAEGEGEGRLSVKDMKNLISRGHEIAVHGHEHKSPVHSSDLEIIDEFLTCRQILECVLGEVITGMAYPDLPIDLAGPERYREIRTLLSSLGISYSRSFGGDNCDFSMPNDFLSWIPTVHHDNNNALAYAKDFVSLDPNGRYNSHRNPVLFYTWGHSYEFSSNNNWEHFEELCAILGNKEDIWYATNIEIYRYTKAYEGLVFNADGTRVYNPSAYDIWFESRHNTYMVAAGQTTDLI